MLFQIMARSRRQQSFEFRTWGGRRARAGRRPNGQRAGVSHLSRPSHSWRHPLHVTLKVKQGVPSLREHALFVMVRRALAAAKQQFGFSLVHFSVQRDHVHLLAEAQDRRALSRGVQGLAIRVALAVNRQLQRKGRLFADRYHARALKTPREAGFALRYVLLNARKHAARTPKGSAGALRRRKSAVVAPSGAGRSRKVDLGVPWGWVDGCSSAAWFRDFVRPDELAFGARQCRQEFARRHPSLDAPVIAPETWLLRSGYQRAGPFDVDDSPA